MQHQCKRTRWTCSLAFPSSLREAWRSHVDGDHSTGQCSPRTLKPNFIVQSPLWPSGVGGVLLWHRSTLCRGRSAGITCPGHASPPMSRGPGPLLTCISAQAQASVPRWAPEGRGGRGPGSGGRLRPRGAPAGRAAGRRAEAGARGTRGHQQRPEARVQARGVDFVHRCAQRVGRVRGPGLGTAGGRVGVGSEGQLRGCGERGAKRGRRVRAAPEGRGEAALAHRAGPVCGKE